MNYLTLLLLFLRFFCLIICWINTYFNLLIVISFFSKCLLRIIHLIDGPNAKRRKAVCSLTWRVLPFILHEFPSSFSFTISLLLLYLSSFSFSLSSLSTPAHARVGCGGGACPQTQQGVGGEGWRGEDKEMREGDGWVNSSLFMFDSLSECLSMILFHPFLLYIFVCF